MTHRPMRFLMIVEDPAIAHYVGANGVDRLFVDLEVHGKNERQKHVASWKSRTTLADAREIRDVAPDCEMLVRVNPLHRDSRSEIDSVCELGAECIMLPMFRALDELRSFAEMVDGRAKTVPLFETVDSLTIVREAAREKLLDEAHFGLNDLHLDRGDVFMFQPVADGLLEEPCAVLRDYRIPFGIGGLARAHEGILSPEFLLGEHVRLGSTGAILSRTFHRGAGSVDELQSSMDFASEVEKLRLLYRDFCAASADELARNRLATIDRVADVVALIKSRTKAV